MEGIDPPLGGLNVIVCDDFWQLDPPDGGFCGSVPTQYIQEAKLYRATPTVAHGHSLLWSGPQTPKTGTSGVSELFQCERCDDVWLREFQEQMRHGRLSEYDHNFLHGALTNVPGSWEDDDVKCNRPTCTALASKNRATPCRQHGILRHECQLCKEERASKNGIIASQRSQIG